jgi:hypothetical protein
MAGVNYLVGVNIRLWGCWGPRCFAVLLWAFSLSFKTLTELWTNLFLFQ